MDHRPRHTFLCLHGRVELFFEWIKQRLKIKTFHAFEKAPLAQVLSHGGYAPQDADIHTQLSLCDL